MSDPNKQPNKIPTPGNPPNWGVMILMTVIAGILLVAFVFDGALASPGRAITLEQFTQDYKGGKVVLSQPKDTWVMPGNKTTFHVDTQGEGLTYQWYICNAGSDTWSKSSLTGSSYGITMTKARAGRQVYCVITDNAGNTVTSDIVTLALAQE